ncbi:hypothetical protein AB986_08555 [Alkalihalobacillus macyae]|uniref:Uncharacterized protein n=1 Tax=Guptibacillus hwajinpoensis TaxID=208199 RepID=A0A0J6FY35_9BACL|nr:hypothetical protein AB986_08555 [Alkalihalobacillus macyae]
MIITLIWFLVPTSMGVTFLYWGLREVWRERKSEKRIGDYLDNFLEFSVMPTPSEGIHILVGVILILIGVISLFITS